MRFGILLSGFVVVLNIISLFCQILAASFDIVRQDKQLLYSCSFAFVLCFGVPANILAMDFYSNFHDYEATTKRKFALIFTFCWNVLISCGLVILNNVKGEYFLDASLESIWWNFMGVVCGIDFCYCFYLIRKLQNFEYYQAFETAITNP